MGCGCGGASNVYQAPDQAGATAGQVMRPDPPTGGPKVWNGPSPKVAAKT